MRSCVLSLSLCLITVACGEETTPSTPTPTVEPPPDPVPPPEPAAEPPAPPPPDSRIEPVGPYQADVGRDCDGLPALGLTTAEGLCVGIALHADVPAIAAEGGRFRPRTIAQDPVRDTVFWIADNGARRARAGRLWRIERGADGAWSARAILRRLDRPHQVRVGPEGRLYVGEVHRIIAIDPAADDPAATLAVVIDDLPFALPNRPVRFHPLKAFVFSPTGDVVLNMGSGTDRCLEHVALDRCADETEHWAGIWRFRYLGEGRYADRPEYVAQGLRNSVALAAHPSGTILQGENAVDYREPDSPHEELNVIRDGRHYGWPYCFDRDGRDPDWAHSSFGCDPATNPEYEPPRLLLPPHGAPLDLLFYTGPLAPISGRLLVSYHGYRDLGHRVLAYPIDARGIPPIDATASDVIVGWEAGDRGPRGAPVGMTQARDGSVWLVEDNNGTVLRLARDAYAAHRAGGPAIGSVAPEPDPGFASVHREVFAVRCAPCHEFLRGEPADAFGALWREGWLREEDGRTRIEVQLDRAGPRPMPPDGPLSPAQARAVREWLRTRAP
ncbi:MAG: PQQ-dependent sugar dehydrogenase [Sandaracinaceae bacterium]